LVFPICDDHQILGVSRCGDSWWLWSWRRCCCLVRLPAFFIAHCQGYELLF